MLTSTATARKSFASIYDTSGKTLSLLRFEPSRWIATSPEQGSITTEDNKDKVTLSTVSIEQSQQAEDAENKGSKLASATPSDQENTTRGQPTSNLQKLTPAEEKMIQQLKVRDREVKAHELAHLASAGQYARGGPTYSYQLGPDGQRYAIGGEVSIDISPEKSPELTIQKMQVVKRAAMAPAEPSSADRSIAAAATALEAQARQEEAQAAQLKSNRELQAAANNATSGKEEPLPADKAAMVSAGRTRPLHIVA